MTKIEIKLEYYKSLPYKRRVYPMLDADDTKYYLAEIIDLPDCIIDGDSPLEAMSNLDSAFEEYILSRLELNYPIAKPKRKIAFRRGRKQKFDAKIVIPLVKDAKDTHNWKDKSQPALPTVGTAAIHA